MFPDMRDKDCHHKLMSWSGSMPCTGTYRCAMCGLSVDDIYAQEGVKNLTSYGISQVGRDRLCMSPNPIIDIEKKRLDRIANTRLIDIRNGKM